MVKLLLIISMFSANLGLAAEGRPFVISSSSLPAQAPSTDPVAGAEVQPPPGESNVIDRLKQMVVLDYLRSALGTRFSDYAPQVTPDFSEDYILDYKVNRKEVVAGATAPPVMELTGHLDVEGLNRWIRLNETKARGSASLRPVFVLSSEIPGLSFSPGNSATTVKTSPVGQAFYADLNRVFKKFNTDLSLAPDRSLLLAAPAETPAQLSELKDYAGTTNHNSVAWVHLQPCRSPGCGMRAEIHTYNLAQGRRLFVQSASLKMSTADMADSGKVQAAIDPLIKDYASRFEDAVSKGTLFSTSYRLIVRNVDMYRSYKKLKTGLTKLEFLVQAVPKRVRANESEFQVLSPLNGRELAQRLQMTHFPGFQLAATSADSSSVEMRLLQQGGAN